MCPSWKSRSARFEGDAPLHIPKEARPLRFRASVSLKGLTGRSRPGDDQQTVMNYNGTKLVAADPTVRKASLTIRNIPGSVLARLRERAQRHRRSMQGEILSILETAVAERAPRMTPGEFLRHVQSLGIKTRPESADMIRKDRDAR